MRLSQSSRARLVVICLCSPLQLNTSSCTKTTYACATGELEVTRRTLCLEGPPWTATHSACNAAVSSFATTVAGVQPAQWPPLRKIFGHHASLNIQASIDYKILKLTHELTRPNQGTAQARLHDSLPHAGCFNWLKFGKPHACKVAEETPGVELQFCNASGGILAPATFRGTAATFCRLDQNLG